VGATSVFGAPLALGRPPLPLDRALPERPPLPPLPPAFLPRPRGWSGSGPTTGPQGFASPSAGASATAGAGIGPHGEASSVAAPAGADVAVGAEAGEDPLTLPHGLGAWSLAARLSAHSRALAPGAGSPDARLSAQASALDAGGPAARDAARPPREPLRRVALIAANFTRNPREHRKAGCGSRGGGRVKLARP